MMGSFLITQSEVPPCVVQGAYEWLFGEEQQVQISQIGTDWIQGPSSTPQQYELFEDPWVENSPIFKDLVSLWRAERGVSSSTTDIVLSPSYQSIIGMGPKVVPLILAQMESEGDDPDQWFWALQVLTRANPVVEEDEGNFKAMAASWIDWARRRYIW